MVTWYHLGRKQMSETQVVNDRKLPKYHHKYRNYKIANYSLVNTCISDIIVYQDYSLVNTCISDLIGFQDYSLVELDVNSSEFVTIQCLFIGKMKCAVKKIFRVQNHKLWEKYSV